MTISIIGVSSNTINTSVSQVAAGSEPQSPLSTLQNKDNSAIAQLSALGQAKASLTDLQNKAQALKNFSKPPTFTDFQLVVQGFVQSFNSLNKNISALKQSALNADNLSGQALNNVSMAIAGTNESGFFSLQKMGISQQASGSFSINQNQLEKSFQDNRPGVLSTVFDLANRVTQTIDKQTSANGFIGMKVNDLSVHVNEFGSMRNSAQGYWGTQKNPQQFVMAQSSSTGGYATRNAVAAYSSVASL